jgi:hypothetical protein
MACKHWQGDARDAPPGAFSSDGLPLQPPPANCKLQTIQYILSGLWPARTSRAQRAASGEAARPTTRSAICQQPLPAPPVATMRSLLCPLPLSHLYPQELLVLVLVVVSGCGTSVQHCAHLGFGAWLRGHVAAGRRYRGEAEEPGASQSQSRCLSGSQDHRPSNPAA